MAINNKYTAEEYALCTESWNGSKCGHGISHSGEGYCPICLDYASNVRKPRLVGITMPDGQVVRLDSGSDLVATGKDSSNE